MFSVLYTLRDHITHTYLRKTVLKDTCWWCQYIIALSVNIHEDAWFGVQDFNFHVTCTNKISTHCDVFSILPNLISDKAKCFLILVLQTCCREIKSAFILFIIIFALNNMQIRLPHSLIQDGDSLLFLQ